MSLEQSAYILSLIAGWLVAQGIKFLISLRQDGFSLDDMVASGGMPSSHSSLVASIATVIGLVEGFDSAIFGLAAAFVGVVAYDAIGVRRATGQNTLALQKLMKQLKIKEPKRDLYLSLGHTPMQVLAGLTTGVVTGFIIHSIVF